MRFEPAQHIARPQTRKADAPNLVAFGVQETQLVERDRHLDQIALVVDAASRIPDHIPGEVLAVVHLAVEAIHLYAAGVDAKFEATPRIVVGVEHDGHVVVLLEGGLAIAVH